MTNRRFSGMTAFYLLMVGQLVSTIGSSMTRFGMGIWTLNELGDNSAYTSLLFFAIFPTGLGSLFAGPFVDRWDRKTTMIVGNIVASLSTLAIVMLLSFDVLQLWHLYITSAINGVANVFVFLSLDASLPLFVPKEQLGRAIGMTQMIWSLEFILGPAIAGLLIGRIGINSVFFADFLTFSTVIFILFWVVVPSPQRSPGGAKERFVDSFSQGVRYVLDRPAFLYLISLVTLTLFLSAGIAYGLVTPFVLSFASEEAAGFVLSSYGLGSLIGSLAFSATNGPKRRMRWVIICFVMQGLANIYFAVRPDLYLANLGMFLNGVAFATMIGLNRLIWSVKAEPGILGRIFALRIALGVGGQAIGVAIAGPLADTVFIPFVERVGGDARWLELLVGTGPGQGLALLIVLAGVIMVVIGLISAASRSVRTMEDQIPDYVEPRVTAPTK